jgi:TatD DNase family protein
MLTDTHIHLYSEEFAEDVHDLIAQAQELGVERFFLPAIDAEYYPVMKALKQRYGDRIFLMAGLHPTHVKDDIEYQLSVVEYELSQGYAVAVGEIGIDLYWDSSTLEVQRYAFEKQIIWASQLDLPIVIHCRDAFDAVFETLEALRNKGTKVEGILHCFTGTLEQARRAIALDLALGIGGVVTFKNGQINQFLDQIDLRHIVLETDAPYLAPAPYRGKRNKPAYLYQVLQKVALCYALSEEEVAMRTTENALRIFKH